MSRAQLHTAPPAFWEDDAAGRRAIGRMAGIMFAVGGAVTAPSLQLMAHPSPPILLRTIAPFGAFLCAVTCLLIPWQRLPASWLQLVPVVGTLQVAVVAWRLGVHGGLVAWFYVFIVVFAALAFKSRAHVAAQVGFAMVALAAPALYAPHAAHDTIVRTIVALPTLAVAAAAVAFLRERLEIGHDAMRRVAERDPLTGVGNYRTLYERLDYEIVRHARHNRRFALALLDLNDFKQVNELHGHLVGDRLLRDVGEVLVGTVRGQDTVARQGGDEFSVLAPESGPVDALALARRLQRELRKVTIGDRQITTSIGWAVFPEHGTTPEELLGHADAALWRSKHDSRAAQAS